MNGAAAYLGGNDPNKHNGNANNSYGMYGTARPQIQQQQQPQQGMQSQQQQPQQSQQQVQNLQSAAMMRRRPIKLELSEEQKAEIREAFEIFDMDKDGALDFHEFKVRTLAVFKLL